MSAHNDFVVAAASYFGLPLPQLMKGSTLDVSTGNMEVVLRIELTNENVVAIGKRMSVMMVEAKVDETQAARKALEQAQAEPSREALHKQWNSLPAHQRSTFGSFHKFVAAYSQADPYTQVAGAGVGEARKAAGLDLPPHVWIDPRELTSAQAAMAVGMDPTTGKYAMDPADLTPEQRAEYAPNHGGENGNG